MATIIYRGNKWQIRVRRRGYPDVAKSFDLKEDAVKWARRIERQMDLGEFSPTEVTTVTLGELLDRYEREVTPKKRGAAQEHYRLVIIKADKVSKLNVKAVTPSEVAGFRDRRLGKVKPVTALHDLCTLSAVFEHARLEWSIAVSNPVKGIRKPSMGEGRERRLIGNEYSSLLAELKQCRSPWVAPMFEFSVETACRRGEALKLRWADVDLSRRLAVLRGTKTGGSRIIPLSSKAAMVLETLPRDLNGVVFPVPTPTLRSAFEHACDRAKIRDLRWHDLRHEGVSRLHELGLSTIEVASISGHKTLACLARYSHMQVETLARKLG